MTIAVKITMTEDADTYGNCVKSDVRPIIYVSYIHASTRRPVEIVEAELTPSRREIICHVTDTRDIRISRIPARRE
jgi:hypothetical protein